MTGISLLTTSRNAFLSLLVLGSVPLQALAQDRYMLVLDASNSMWGQIEGRSKMDLAQEVIGDLAREWPSDRPMGLVAYGHRDKRCSDIETLVPAETFDVDRFVRGIETLKPRGRTPLAASLRHAAEALDYRNQPATLIIVSDGVESCGQDPCAVTRQLEADNPSLTAHVVGFGLAADAADSQLACIAELSGGRYFTAGNQSELYQVARAIFAATGADAAQAERPEIGQERALQAQVDKLDSALASDHLEQAEEALQALQAMVADLPEQQARYGSYAERVQALREAERQQERAARLLAASREAQEREERTRTLLRQARNLEQSGRPLEAFEAYAQALASNDEEEARAGVERLAAAQMAAVERALSLGAVQDAETLLQTYRAMTEALPEQQATLRALEEQLEALRTARASREPIDKPPSGAPEAETADDAQSPQPSDAEISGPDGDGNVAGTSPEGAVQAQRSAAEPPVAVRRESAAGRHPFEPEMVSLSGGCFQMGSPSDEHGREDNELRHRVCVEDFSIGKYEVTQAQWQAVMGSDPSRFGNCDDCPVESVSWTEANDYIAALNAHTGQRYRLPTEAEWEYAARAGTTTPFWSGTCIHTDQANYAGEYDYDSCGAKTGVDRRKTLPVGSLRSNPWGLYDVAGNVAEWTCSTYGEDYEGAEQRCESNDFSGRVVLRGGSWYNSPRWVRSAARAWLTAAHRLHDLGFRLVRD